MGTKEEQSKHLFNNFNIFILQYFNEFNDSFAMFLAAKYGRTSMPTWAAAICGALSWFNGNYYAARVVASAGQNGWRPS